MAQKDIVVSGMRPTGRLHIGNYWGALHNWVGLQDRYPCYFFVADWHMLTTGFDDTSKLQENIREIVLDWLASGLDPQKCVIFKQSDVPEHAELALMLGMTTPLAWLENNPTWNEQLQELAKTKASLAAEELKELVRGDRAAKPSGKAAPADAKEARRHEEERAKAERLRTYGFLGYPLMQAADIMMYRGTKVPVGQDQLPHLELSREIARRFNSVYDGVLPEPQPLLTPTPKVPGLDGRKMSKSYGNAIDIYESEKSLASKIMGSYTDPTRKRSTDPGHPVPSPENPPGCTIFALHQLYSPADFAARRKVECMAGQLGCVACKKDLLGFMEPRFAEFRKRREEYAAQSGRVEEVLAKGAEKARETARRTMDDVRRAMRLK